VLARYSLATTSLAECDRLRIPPEVPVGAGEM
jgi:hypothetical protein